MRRRPVVNNEPLNWLEVMIKSKPVETPQISIMKIVEDEGLCPQSHPNAYLQGEHCCEINTDFDSLMTIISPALSFVSTTCKDAFGTNRHVACPHPPCLNFQYQPYRCFLDNLDISGSKYRLDATIILYLYYNRSY